jgi:hypothetical protein
MNKRELAHLVLGLSVMALTVGISLVVGRADTRLSQANLYLDHHHVPGPCGVGQELFTIYASGFEPHEGYGRDWRVDGYLSTWAVIDIFGYKGYGWHAHAYVVSDQHLISPPLDLPSHANRIQLRFYNRQEIEPAKNACHDGGVLEITTDGGATWSQVPNDKLSNDLYDGIVSPHLGNPLAGRLAWCGGYYGYWQEVIVDLDEYAGETVTLRFRLGTDQSVGSNWRIDEVRVQACRYLYAHPLYLPVVFR